MPSVYPRLQLLVVSHLSLYEGPVTVAVVLQSSLDLSEIQVPKSLAHLVPSVSLFAAIRTAPSSFLKRSSCNPSTIRGAPLVLHFLRRASLQDTSVCERNGRNLALVKTLGNQRTTLTSFGFHLSFQDQYIQEDTWPVPVFVAS